MHRDTFRLLLTFTLALGCAQGHRLPGDGRDGGPEDREDAGPLRPVDAGPDGCSALTCDANASCVDSAGGPMCVCNAGYEGTGRVCSDIDECAAAPDPCAPGACTNTVGGYSCDLCPDDPTKTEPGACGCGVPDADSDFDGTPNCNDGCPMDALKTAPGACGCGNPDTDSDFDGTANCNDGCPMDALKTAPGACGCGNPDTDSDGDATADCVDGCPSDPLKTAPGTCGCGTPDTDSDGDGTPDCDDGCPSDPLKTSPGSCGCGVPETGGGTTSTIGEPRTRASTQPSHFRGNAYQVTASRTLASFEQFLTVPSGCTLGFYVLRGSSPGGPWTTVWSREHIRSGAAYHSSGPINITLSAGSYYALGVGWTCSVTFHSHSSTWGAINIGTFRNNVWDNGYTGYTTVYSPPEDGTAAVAYAQRVTTGGCP